MTMKRKLGVFLGISVILAGAVFASTFRDQRNKFRDEIDLKVADQLDKAGLYSSVTFKNEKAWDFKVSPDEKTKIKTNLKNYFNTSDDQLLEKMVTEVNRGRYVIFEEFPPNGDGVNLKCAFLSPKVPYWKPLTDIQNIEDKFYVYDFSLLLGNKGPNDNFVVLATEGKFMGFGKSVVLPLYFHADEPNRVLSFREATQKEAQDMANALPVLKPGRTSLQDRFIDLCRTYPWFQDKDGSGNYVVSDKDILDILDKTILNKDKRCDVYESTGGWKVYENVSDNYSLVNYSLKSVVNVEAFIPPSVPLLGSMFKKVAQSVSDEVSAKYLPLSMKNFRDHTVEWAKSSK
jgi:hypothetical protein